MSEHGSLQFVWDIMLQSEWWKQYSEMVERSLAEQAGEGNADLGFDAGSWSGSWTGSYSALLMSSGSGSAAGSGAWWASYRRLGGVPLRALGSHLWAPGGILPQALGYSAADVRWDTAFS